MQTKRQNKKKKKKLHSSPKRARYNEPEPGGAFRVILCSPAQPLDAMQSHGDGVHVKQPDYNHPPPSTPSHDQKPRMLTHRRELRVLIALRALLGDGCSPGLPTNTNNLRRVPVGHAAHRRLILSLHPPPSLHHCLFNKASESGT